MTNEQIADMKLHWQPARTAGSEAVKDIDRVLDERERLLDAVRLAVCPPGTNREAQTSMLRQIQRAIAYAEDPAP